MAFIVGEAGEYSWPITFKVPPASGAKTQWETHSMIFRFKEMTQDRFNEIYAQSQAEADQPNPSFDWSELCREVVVGWTPNGKVYLDTDGSPAEFSDVNLESLIGLHCMIASTIGGQWLDCVLQRQEGKAKNSGGRPFTG